MVNTQVIQTQDKILFQISLSSFFLIETLSSTLHEEGNIQYEVSSWPIQYNICKNTNNIVNYLK